jgi:hypothetical protein
MNINRWKCILALLLLTVLDFAPFPVMGIFAWYILLFLPDWFKGVMDKLYSSK